jgi:hypothetical protein
MSDSSEDRLRLAQQLESEGRMGEATAILRDAARAKDAQALAALGKHLMVHRPDCAREGIEALLAAASAGNAEAAHILAVFIAEGVGFAQSWPSALGLLQRSADSGFEPAQRELAFLAGLSAGVPSREAGSPEDWGALRKRVDIAPLLASPPAHAVCTSPRIFAIDGFASPRLCDWLVGLGRPWLKSATTYDPATGAQRYEAGRTNSDCHLVLPHSDLVLAAIRQRIANAVSLPLRCFEITTMLHYRPGQEFAPHHDFLDDALPGYAQEIEAGGQRVLTFLLYLNDGFEGGETDFPLAGVRYKGRKGDAVFFWNVTPDGALDRRTLHAGLAPITGEKCLLSQWVRNRAS